MGRYRTGDVDAAVSSYERALDDQSVADAYIAEQFYMDVESRGHGKPDLQDRIGELVPDLELMDALFTKGILRIYVPTDSYDAAGGRRKGWERFQDVCQLLAARFHGIMFDRFPFLYPVEAFGVWRFHSGYVDCYANYFSQGVIRPFLDVLYTLLSSGRTVPDGISIPSAQSPVSEEYRPVTDTSVKDDVDSGYSEYDEYDDIDMSEIELTDSQKEELEKEEEVRTEIRRLTQFVAREIPELDGPASKSDVVDPPVRTGR